MWCQTMAMIKTWWFKSILNLKYDFTRTSHFASFMCDTHKTFQHAVYISWTTCLDFASNVRFLMFFVPSLQVLLDTTAFRVRVNTSIAVWGITVWSTMRLVKGSVSAWITVNHTINQCAVQMESCTRTTVSSTGPPVSEDTKFPSCTVRSASTKVRAWLPSCNMWTQSFMSCVSHHVRLFIQEWKTMMTRCVCMMMSLMLLTKQTIVQ